MDDSFVIKGPSYRAWSNHITFY